VGVAKSVIDERFPWERVLETIRTRQPELYRAWFDELPPAVIDGGELHVLVPDSARAEYLREQCTRAFAEAATSVTGYLLTVRFRSQEDSNNNGSVSVLSKIVASSPLNPDYTFDQFVVGPSNRLAHAACRAVCSQPGTLYNPLFLHGASGLGKTHLLHAVCAELKSTTPGMRFLYMSCETFVNEFVRAIEDGTLPEFRDRARETDVLVIDDIQFLANRESSQEELFHTFNVLYQNRSQIILSADARPTDIPTLEDRLVSRFNWGLVTQIDPPNRETRHAILAKKARLRGCEIPAEVLDFIAQRVEDNVRVLEGTLTKLISEAQIADKPLTVDTAKRVLQDIQGFESKPLQVGDIIQLVSTHFGIKVSEILGRKRSRSIALPRQVAMYLTRKLTPLSLEEIGGHFGGRDHSTVLHAERSIEAERLREPAMAETLTKLTRQLLARH
jgi:chromosomal replication initiator protein